MENDNNISLAANLFPPDPRPSIEECVIRLENVAHGCLILNSQEMEREITVLHNVKSMVIYDEKITSIEQDKFLKRLDLCETIIKHKCQLKKQTENEEDEYRISKGLEPKYDVSKALMEYIYSNNGELLKDKILLDIESKISYLGYALLHYYWHKFSKDKSKEINQNTYKRWADKYGIKAADLWEKAKPMLALEPQPIHHNFNSITAYGKQYELILPILNGVCEPAALEVENKLKRLKNLYPAYFPSK